MQSGEGQSDLRADGGEIFRRAFEDAPVAMGIVGLDGRILRANRALVLLTGYSAEELLFMEPEGLAHPDDAGLSEHHMQRAIAGQGDMYRVEKRWSDASTHQIRVAISASLIRDEKERPLFFIWHVEDRSVRHLEEHRLRHIADHDELTGIGNRRFLHEALEQQLARSRRYGESGALLVLDLDGFKAVNDTVGHAGGDDVLRATAQALVRRARDSDLVARLGGDEFAVLLLHVDEAYADRVAEELREAVDEALAEACEEVPVGASFGRVMLSAASDGVEELLAEADAAMYAAKRERGGAGSRRFSR